MTFDEARLMANVNARAETLFQSGYRARWDGTNRLLVRNEKGTAYLVETVAQTCDCPFFQAHQGRLPCKHILGWPRLLWRQRACRRMLSLLLLDLWNDLDEWQNKDEWQDREEWKEAGDSFPKPTGLPPQATASPETHASGETAAASAAGEGGC